MVHQVPTELTLLVVAVIVGLVQVIWAAAAGAGGARDPAWLLGPRDDPRPTTGVAARLERAFANFLETFPLFAAAVIAADLAGKLGALTLWGSAIYVWLMLPPSLIRLFWPEAGEGLTAFSLGLFLFTLVLSWRLTNTVFDRGPALATGVFTAMFLISLIVLFTLQGLFGLVQS